MLKISKIIGVFIMVLVSFEASRAQSISTEQNYAANSPGVVMVQTVFSATVYVNKVQMNERRFQQLVDSVKRLDTTGTMFTADEKLDIVVKALYNSPFRFFYPTTEYFRQRHRILSSGTGFFVTGDGYLVTNAHIIDRDSGYIRRKFILSTFREVTDANIRSLQASWAMTLSDEHRNLLNNAYSVIYSQVSSMIIFDLKKEIFVQLRADGGNITPNSKRLEARLVAMGSAMPGKDVAILKVNDAQTLPTLPVSLDSIPSIGEQVLVYGYPEPVTSNLYLARETSINPTLTAGIVSAIKKSIGGWPVVQMDALISHGSSGSPVCNNRGEVIGLATFGSLEQNTGGLATGFNFAIPVSVIREFLDTAGITPSMSRASTNFNNGLSLFYKAYYQKALNEFQKVRNINPEYPQLAYYIERSKSKFQMGADKEISRTRYIYRLIAISLLIGGAAFVFYRRNKVARKIEN